MSIYAAYLARFRKSWWEFEAWRFSPPRRNTIPAVRVTTSAVPATMAFVTATGSRHRVGAPGAANGPPPPMS
jgi:hypothetical protein